MQQEATKSLDHSHSIVRGQIARDLSVATRQLAQSALIEKPKALGGPLSKQAINRACMEGDGS